MSDFPLPNPSRRSLFAVWRWPRRVWGTWAVLLPVWYFLSSGPVLATAFWLRDRTGWDGFYSAMIVYVPILWLPRSIWDAYITWWVEFFGTTGPG